MLSRKFKPFTVIAAAALFILPSCDSGAPPAGASSTVAPNIAFVQLGTGAPKKLSDFRGKIVVLDFWATWCPPCQIAMARMQTYRAAHPEWGTQVELVTLSVDASRALVEKHLAERGWNKTFNAWLGENPSGAEAFNVRTLPHAVVLDRGGVIVARGHPGELQIPALVDQLLASNK